MPLPPYADPAASPPVMADRLAEVAHWGQVRRDGSPFVRHCRRVRDLAVGYADLVGCGPDVVELVAVVALLHDTVEDTSLQPAFITEKFGDHVAAAVGLLTRTRTRVDRESANKLYNHRLSVSGNLAAALVKAADVRDNARDALALIAAAGDDKARRDAVSFGGRWAVKAFGALSAAAAVLVERPALRPSIADVVGDLCRLSDLVTPDTVAQYGFRNL